MLRQTRKLNMYLLAVLIAIPFSFFQSSEVYALRDIVYPVLGVTSYTNDFLAPRSSGLHHATDIFGAKHIRVVSPVDGTITYAPYPQPPWGWMVSIVDDDGFRYSHIHMNNDTPGTDDGSGGPMFAYAPDVRVGNRVVRGQLIGYLGDSGNAEFTPPHIHFEMERPNGDPINPFFALNNAERITSHVKNYPDIYDEFTPFDNSLKGGRIAMGEFDPDTTPEIIAAGGPGSKPLIRVFEQDETKIGDFLAFREQFRGGIDIEACDTDGDTIDEIIAVRGEGGKPTVKIFELDGTLVETFDAYSTNFLGAINITCGDIDGDLDFEILTTKAYSGVPTARVFQPDGTYVNTITGFTNEWRGGLNIAVGDIDNDATDEIIFAKSAPGDSRVNVMESDETLIFSKKVYADKYRGGVKVDIADVDISSAEEEIVTVQSEMANPRARTFDETGKKLEDRYFFEEWWEGFNDIAGGYDIAYALSGQNRRVTVRIGIY